MQRTNESEVIIFAHEDRNLASFAKLLSITKWHETRTCSRYDKKLLGTTNFPYLGGMFAVGAHCANKSGRVFGLPTVITAKGPLPAN